MAEFNIEKYSEEIEKLDLLLDKYYGRDGALIPVLQETQELFGYLPREILEKISRKLQVPIARIYGVATFYAQFTFVPTGKYKISVCMGTACYVKGAEDILNNFQSHLGIGLGETTQDQKFSLIETRCVGECSLAPLVVVNEKRYPHFKMKDVDKLIEELRGEE